MCTLCKEMELVYAHYGSDHSTAGVSDSKNLAPMYERLHAAIRKYDNDHIVFFEPTVILTEVSSVMWCVCVCVCVCDVVCVCV